MPSVSHDIWTNTDRIYLNKFCLSLQESMGESLDKNPCILLVSQPSTESIQDDMEMEEKAQNGTSLKKSQSYLLNVDDCGQPEKKLKMTRSSSLTSRLSVGLRSINSQIMELPGTLRLIYIIIPMLCAAFLIGVFVGSVLSTFFKFK